MNLKQAFRYQNKIRDILHHITIHLGSRSYITTVKSIHYKKDVFPSMENEELIENIKTKRYTYQKIGRMLTHILCNFSKDDADDLRKLKYIRVLGFSSKGQRYLNAYKKKIDLPIITTFKKMNQMLEMEFRATCTYASILDEDDKQALIEAEYKQKPIMK